jgi:hypothetical protein
MGIATPKLAYVEEAVDRALNGGCRDIPVALTNLLPALRWNLAGLEISEQVLAEHVRKRAAELHVALID